MKKIYIIILCCLMTVSVSRAGDIYVPPDLPTFEALMNLHKTLAKWEESSKNQVAAGKLSQDGVTKETNKFCEVRDALNSKLEAGHQWIYLAGLISQLTLESINVTKEYTEFAKFYYSYAHDKPQITLQFAECNYFIYKNVKLIQKSMATLAAENFNVFYCTMEERMNLIFDLQQQLEQIRSIIEDNYWYARCIVNGGFHYDFIWEILNSKMLDEIAKGIISDWNSNLAGTGGDPDLEEDDWDDGTPSQGDDDSFYDPGIPDDIYSPIDINTSI